MTGMTTVQLHEFTACLTLPNRSFKKDSQPVRRQAKGAHHDSKLFNLFIDDMKEVGARSTQKSSAQKIKLGSAKQTQRDPERPEGRARTKEN